jgi:hypothetical protein
MKPQKVLLWFKRLNASEQAALLRRLMDAHCYTSGAEGARMPEWLPLDTTRSFYEEGRAHALFAEKKELTFTVETPFRPFPGYMPSDGFSILEMPQGYRIEFKCIDPSRNAWRFFVFDNKGLLYRRFTQNYEAESIYVHLYKRGEM